MKPKSIIMKAHDVQALLRGDKTQFRVPVKPQPHEDLSISAGFYCPELTDKNGFGYPGPEIFGAFCIDGLWATPSPYQPGQIVYVRETWFSTRFDYKDQLEYGNRSSIRYAADGIYCPRRDCVGRHWFSPSQMPQSAARIWLQVESVRVERGESIWEWVIDDYKILSTTGKPELLQNI